MAATSVMLALSGHRGSPPDGFSMADFGFAAEGLCNHLPWDIHPSKLIMRLSKPKGSSVSLEGCTLHDVTGAKRLDLFGSFAAVPDAVILDLSDNRVFRATAGLSYAFVRAKANAVPEIRSLLSNVAAATALAEYSGAREQAALLGRLQGVLTTALLAAGREGSRHYPAFGPSVGTPQVVTP